MKRIFTLMIFAAAMVFAGCSKDSNSDNPNDPNNPENPVPDPTGTITANISDDSDTHIKIDGYGAIGWAGPDNFYLYGERPNYNYQHNVSICDLGPMQGLGNITSIPSAGFTTPKSSDKSVACEAGHGYVVKFDLNPYYGYGVVYVRLYVVEPVVSTTGGIMGAKVKYQYPFEPTTLNVSKAHLEFPVEGGSAQTVEITTDASAWNWSFNPGSYSTSWVSVNKNNNTLSISVEPNQYIPNRSANISITAREKTKHITISQNGVTSTSAPYAVGDAYKENGVEGIVFFVIPDGSHGLIVSLDDTVAAWTTMASSLTYTFGCTDLNNGMNNLESIKLQPSWEGRFPAFKWCSDKGHGWYLPAAGELMMLYAAYCGLHSYPGQEVDAPAVYSESRQKFDATLVLNSGSIIMTSSFKLFAYHVVGTFLPCVR
jgi:hypothetical protein